MGLKSLRGIDFAAVAAMLAIAVMMTTGGPVPSLFVTTLLAVVGLLLLGCLGFGSDRGELGQQPVLLRVGLWGIALLPLLQIVPLPPSLWHQLPGQELRIRTLELAGQADTWQPLSVTPLYTAGACVIALAFVALIKVLLTLSTRDVRRVAALVLGLVALNILIGLVQVASGGSSFQFYAASDHGALIGFHANKNHAALVLAASLPIAAFFLGSREDPRGSRIWLAVYAGIILVALLTTNSRAGILLGVTTVLLLASLYIRNVRPAYVAAGVVLAVVAVAVISTTPAFERLYARFGTVSEDLRWEFLRNSAPLIDRYWIFGSGIGSFSTLYAANEDLAWLQPKLINQLHNEYPQLLLEAGLPGVALLATVVIGLVWSGWQLWKSAGRRHHLPLLCGALMLVLIAVHSAVDYPLRRPAVLPILALAVVFIIRGDLTASTGLERRRPRS